jgi:hypothetical protein
MATDDDLLSPPPIKLAVTPIAMNGPKAVNGSVFLMQRRFHAIAGSTALLAGALGPLVLPAGSAEALTGTTVTFSLGGPLSQGGVEIASGTNLGLFTVGLD